MSGYFFFSSSSFFFSSIQYGRGEREKSVKLIKEALLARILS
jgi:hypothetical protein